MAGHPTAPVLPAARPPRHRRAWLGWFTALLVGVLLLVLLGRENGEPWLAVTNTSRDVVELRVNGDRLLILQPGETQYLPLSASVWHSPQSVEVRRYPDGPPLLRFRADLTELADHHWRLRVP